MAAEQAVIMGLSVVFIGLAWISFEMNQSENDFTKYLAVIFLALSLAVLQIVGWVVLEIASANGLSYIVNGVTMPLLWIINIVVFLFWFGMLFRSLVYFITALIKIVGKWFGGEVS